MLKSALMGAPVHIARVALTGFMGAGKTTVGRLLASQLSWNFADTDAVLEERTRLSISSIFSLHGEPSFRRMEAEAVARVLTENQIVISLGGGAIEDSGTRTLLFSAPETLVVFLEAPLELLLDRCASEIPGKPVARPLLAGRLNLIERFERRLPLYRNAHLTVPTSARSPMSIAQQIAAVITPKAGKATVYER